MAKKIIKQTASFGVLRANPRISGNVKITVDSSQEIWLNSIDSNPEMSNSAYKGFKINESSSYDKDLYRFFNDGKTPTQFVFGLSGEGDPVQNQIEDLSSSYDFTYAAGVSHLISDKYSESFSYLAPIWIGEDIPENFVIFRINDPIDYSYLIPVTTLEIGKTYKVVESEGIDTTDPTYLPYKIIYGTDTYENGSIFTASQSTIFNVTQGQGSVILLDPLYNLSNIDNTDTHFREKILSKATAVASFDLTEKSKIGSYLRKIKNNPGYTDSLVDVRFEENQITTFNGINYAVGVFDKKGDYLFDYFQQPTTQIGFEDFITDGFRKNGIISYKLLNLEFLFNDNDSKNYTINRYFGLYVNALEMASFRLDGNALYEDQGISGNTPIPERNDKGYYYQDIPYYQYNADGIRLFIDSNKISGVIPNSDDVNYTENNKLFWIKDKRNNFHSFKKDENYITSPSPIKSSYGKSGSENELVIQDTSLNLSLLTGIDINTKKQYSGAITGEKGRAYSVIKIGGELSAINADAFIFYHPLGTYGNIGSKYDIIQASDLSSIVDEWGPGSFYSRDNAYYIHPFGAPSDIALGLTNIFNSFNYNSFEAFQSDDEIIIRVKATGIKENNKYALDFFQNFGTGERMPDSRRGTILINDKDSCDINRKQFFIGGSNYSNTRVKVNIEDANKIIIGETFLETIKNTSTDTFNGIPGYTNKGISLVIGKYRFVDQYSLDKNGKILGLKDIETHAILEISSFTENISLGSIGKISAFDLYNIPLGIFSFYGLREIDGDFWYSEYGYTPTKEYYRHLDVQPDGITNIIKDKTYFVSSGSEILYNGVQLNGPDIFVGVTGEQSYTLLKTSSSAESNVYPTLSSRGNITGPIAPSAFDDLLYPDLDAFPGFYGIQSLNFIDTENAKQTKNSQLLFGKLDSEYDYTNDNYNSKFSTKSRVSPYITKWSYRGGTDVRGNDYRLNSNIAFSPLNFSPSFFRRIQDPQYFTHEWYQLQEPPVSLPEENLHFDKNYLSNKNYFGDTLDIEQLKDANPASRDFFYDYFSVEGEDFIPYYPSSSTIDSINFTERFSIFDYNEGSTYTESLFRGAKIRIKRAITDYLQGKNVRYTKDDRFYEGYKFSCVLVPIKNIDASIQSPFKIKIHENRTFKTITFILELLVDDARAIESLDYFLLYSLKDKIASNTGSNVNGVAVELPILGDIKLSSALNISSSPNIDGLYSRVDNNTQGNTGIIYMIPNPDYDTDLRDEINFTYLPSTDILSISSTGPGTFYGVTGSASKDTDTYILPFPTGVGQNFINFTNTDFPSNKYKFDFEEIGLPSIPGPLFIPTSVSYLAVSNIPIYQREGGINYWRSILEKISFANISLLVNTANPYIEYKSYIWNENTKLTEVLENEFILEFLRPSAFKQDSILISEEDLDKPIELFPFFIGYKEKEIAAETEIYRYSGGYVPKFRDVLKFEDIKFDAPFWTIPNNYRFSITLKEKEVGSTEYDLGSSYCIAIDGISNREITLVKGITYIFDLSDPTNFGYQLYFSENNIGDSYANDALIEGYSLNGIPGTPGCYIEFTVPYNFQDKVYYVSSGGKYMGGKIKVIDSLSYSYCSFGPSKDGFAKIKNINYHKFGEEWIFKIGKDSPYNPKYNLIGETPIDKRDISLFESSWDPGFYRLYTTGVDYTNLPGTRNMKEQKSFFGSKVMQTPNSINSQKQLIYPNSLPDVLNINYNNYPNYEVFWEETDQELRGVLMIDRIITRYFLENGGKNTFREFLVSEFSYGNLTTIDDDFNEYMRLNIIPIFESKNNGAYIKKIPLKNGVILEPVIGNYADYQKLINGYYQSKDIRFYKVNELKYEFVISKDPSFDYSLCFSIEIGKI